MLTSCKHQLSSAYACGWDVLLQALFVRLVPCIGLTVLSLLLVQTMRQAEERRQNLRGKSSAAGKDAAGGGTDRKTNRTTMMLLLVVVLFLVTELPQGVINLLSGLLPAGFVNEIYMALGDLLDILALINNGINFILYCSMSKQFRDTFVSVFHLDALGRLGARCRCWKTPRNSLEEAAPITAPTAVVGGKDEYVLVAQA